MANILKQLKKKIKKIDFDIILTIDGEERSGMSCMAFQLAYYKKDDPKTIGDPA